MVEAIVFETLDRELLDLTSLAPPERAYFDLMLAHWRTGTDFDTFVSLVYGPGNPVLEKGNRVTRRVAENPLYKAVRDLEDRVGIMQGELRPDPDDGPAEVDPTVEEWLSVTEAAERKGVSVPAVRMAIERGDIIGTSGRPVRVSGRSLARWTVDKSRQSAGRARELVTVD